MVTPSRAAHHAPLFVRHTTFFDPSVAYQVKRETLATFNVKFNDIERRLREPLEQVANFF